MIDDERDEEPGKVIHELRVGEVARLAETPLANYYGGDLDGDGLLEYRSRSPNGLRNQGWKDSHDGVMDKAGVPLGPPIALVEVQGYALRAKRGIARLFDLAGETARAEELRKAATVLEEGIERFWLEDAGDYAMALDDQKRPSGALASNQGHLLWADAVPRRSVQAGYATRS